MKYIWTYFLMALCMSMTSARIMDFPGNENGFHDNLVSGVENEKILTPPTTSGLIIDSGGYPGNSNDENIKTFKPENLPPFIQEVLKNLFTKTEESNYNIIPFTKEDIINLENSDLCKMMCDYGVKKPPCKCE